MKSLMIYFWRNGYLPTRVLDLCKNPNQPQLLPSDVKIVLKRMAIEQGIYAQAVMISRNDLDNKKEKETQRNISSKGSL